MRLLICDWLACLTTCTAILLARVSHVEGFVRAQYGQIAKEEYGPCQVRNRVGTRRARMLDHEEYQYGGCG